MTYDDVQKVGDTLKYSNQTEPNTFDEKDTITLTKGDTKYKLPNKFLYIEANGRSVIVYAANSNDLNLGHVLGELNKANKFDESLLSQANIIAQQYLNLPLLLLAAS